MVPRALPALAMGPTLLFALACGSFPAVDTASPDEAIAADHAEVEPEAPPPVEEPPDEPLPEVRIVAQLRANEAPIPAPCSGQAPKGVDTLGGVAGAARG